MSVITQTPLHIEGIEESLYAGFGYRLASMLLDFIILLPFSALLLYLNNLGLYFYFISIIPLLLVSLWYNVYLVKHYGGTPGKLIVGIKIIKISGEKIDWSASIKRHMVDFAFALFTALITIIAITKADESHYKNLSWIEKSHYLMILTPFLYTLNSWLTNIWIFSELIILLTNKRKRAIHDYIANTVIIKTQYVQAIRDSIRNEVLV